MPPSNPSLPNCCTPFNCNEIALVKFTGFNSPQWYDGEGEIRYPYGEGLKGDTNILEETCPVHLSAYMFCKTVSGDTYVCLAFNNDILSVCDPPTIVADVEPSEFCFGTPWKKVNNQGSIVEWNYTEFIWNDGPCGFGGSPPTSGVITLVNIPNTL